MAATEQDLKKSTARIGEALEGVSRLIADLRHWRRTGVRVPLRSGCRPGLDLGKRPRHGNKRSFDGTERLDDPR